MAADHTPFLPQDTQGRVSTRTWLVSAAVVCVLLAVAAVATLRRSPSTAGAELPADPAAASLPISAVTMSEATNGAGGKSTYIDGVLTNNAGKTLQAATVQLTFATADGTAPYRETTALGLVRTRIPYVDLQPISADPIRSGEHREFRLIFESVPPSWNVQPPAIRIVRATLQ